MLKLGAPKLELLGAILSASSCPNASIADSDIVGLPEKICREIDLSRVVWSNSVFPVSLKKNIH